MEAPISEIKPNIKKAFASNLFFVFAIVVLIISILVYLNSIVGLNVFFDAFNELGISVSASSLLFWLIALILLLTVLLSILNYIALAKVSYTLYSDKIEYARNFFIMELSSKTIPYANIAKVYCENKFFLKSAKVIIELTGMKESKVEMDFIDNAQEVVQHIQQLVANYKANYYARYTQDYRYQNVMDKY